jgi:transcriptional regulator with GAF, ATPase, and Fis domain
VRELLAGCGNVTSGKNQQLQFQLEQDYRPGNIVGNSSKMRDVYSLVSMVAETCLL